MVHEPGIGLRHDIVQIVKTRMVDTEDAVKADLHDRDSEIIQERLEIRPASGSAYGSAAGLHLPTLEELLRRHGRIGDTLRRRNDRIAKCVDRTRTEILSGRDLVFVDVGDAAALE